MNKLNKNEELEKLKAELGDLCKQLELMNEEKNCLSNQIKRLLKFEGIRISDHARVRFFERVLGFSIDMIDDMILTEDVKLKYDMFGYGTYYNKDCGVVMRNDSVITILPKDSEEK